MSHACLARSKNKKDYAEHFKQSLEDSISPFCDRRAHSAVHLDGTARVQIIDDQSELIICRLLQEIDVRQSKL